METSVLHVGFLPEPFWGGNLQVASPSALHTTGIVKTPFKLPTIYNPYSSEIKIVYEQGKINVENSTVWLHNQKINVPNYIDDICNGFCHAYRRTIKKKKEMLGLLRDMYSHRSIYLLRNTQQYTMYLNTSFFPEFMKDIENRIYFLHILKKHQNINGYVEKIFEYELLSLLNMDIPIFYFQGIDTRLQMMEEDGYEEYFENIAYQCVEEHISDLSDEDLFRQEMFIRMSIGCNLPEMNGSRNIKIIDRNNISILNSNEKLGQAILRWIIRENDIKLWMTMRFLDTGWGIEKMSMNLYDGIPGLAICFALLSIHTRNTKLKDVYLELCTKMFHYTDRILKKKSDIETNQTGMFVGEGAIVYGYIILYKILKFPKLLEYAKKHVEIVKQLVRGDRNNDLLSGNAGWIIVLAKLYEISFDTQYLDMAIETEKILWNQKVKCPVGVGWVCGKDREALAGMAHGNSGVILAYSYLLKYTRNKVYKNRICKMIEYEDYLYSETKGNWRDLRERGNLCYRANSWCHGGGGILLSRLALLQLEEFQNNGNVKKDIKRGLKCLSYWKKEERICICHGLMGFYLIYKSCKRILDDSYYEIEAKKIREKIRTMKILKIQEFNSTALMSGIPGLALMLSEINDEIIW